MTLLSVEGLGISFGGLIGSLLCAFLGACLLLYLLRLVVK